MKWFKLSIIIFVGLIFSGCNFLNKNLKSGLQVITDNVNSAVFIDDQYLEKAPFINREIKPGKYLLKIQPDDQSLAPYETYVTLRPGLLTVVTWKPGKTPELSGGVIYEMEPTKSKTNSEVSFTTIPDGAIVALQNRDKEFSPVVIKDVNPGHNEFEVSLPSYESQKHTINVTAGYRMLVTVKLAKINPNKPYEDNKEEIKISTSSAENSSATSSATQTNSQVLIKSTNFFNNSKEVLRVRDKAGSSGREIGFAIVGKKYPYLNKSKNNWLNINFNGQVGWVSGNYAEIIEKNKQENK